MCYERQGPQVLTAFVLGQNDVQPAIVDGVIPVGSAPRGAYDRYDVVGCLLQHLGVHSMPSLAASFRLAAFWCARGSSLLGYCTRSR